MVQHLHFHDKKSGGFSQVMEHEIEEINAKGKLRIAEIVIIYCLQT